MSASEKTSVIRRAWHAISALWQNRLRAPSEKGAARFIAMVDRMHTKLVPPDDEGIDAIARKPILFGYWMLALVFGGFVLWAAFTPLASAAVARGVVVLDSNRKTIQHLEGGIIEAILVKDGDLVQAGDALIRLSETAAKARLDALEGQYFSDLATIARLSAERDEDAVIRFPKELLSKNSTSVHEILESQQRLFEVRQKSYQGKVRVLEQNIGQLKEEIEGLKAQERAASKQLSLLREEIGTVKTLVEQGNAARPRLLALQRNAAELEGRRGEYLARMARAEQTIAQTQTEILNSNNERVNEIVDQLRDTQESAASLSEEVHAARDVLRRLEIISPYSGIVTALKFHTKDGVISPGEAVMDIVPQDDKLIIEARISPQDIDVVHQGLPAKVRLSAYKTRQIPPFDGEVLSVSADRFVDENNGEPYYTARILIPAESLDAVENVELYPGMPAEALIVTGDRTMLSYFISPITDSFFRAFREQ